LRAFGKEFDSTPLHQITPGKLEAFINSHTVGWSRKSFHKRLLPFFSYAHRQRWLLANPMDELDSPDVPKSPRAIYTPDQLKKLLEASEWHDNEIARYIGLAGLAFFRTRELVRKLKDEPVLEWRDILLDGDLIHVREEVGKHTSRASNERFVPFHDRLRGLLMLGNTKKHYRHGRIVDVSIRRFRVRLHRVFKRAEVPFIEKWLKEVRNLILASGSPRTWSRTGCAMGRKLGSELSTALPADPDQGRRGGVVCCCVVSDWCRG
jgi:hypothetical protein